MILYVIGPNTFNENETVAKFEIMDGAPVRGESIPIRLFLNGYDLTPTMRDINKKFSVRYYLNLVLVDEEDRRYFKQQVSHQVPLLSSDVALDGFNGVVVIGVINSVSTLNGNLCVWRCSVTELTTGTLLVICALRLG